MTAETPKRGRPLGSKNKPHDVITITIPFQDKAHMTTKTLKLLHQEKHHLDLTLEAVRTAQSKLSELGIVTSSDDLNGVECDCQAKIESLSAEIEARKLLTEKYSLVLFNRTLHELPREISSLRGDIANGQADVDRKRLSLTENGIDDAEAMRIFPNYDATPAIDLLEPLEQELSAWKRFSETGSADDLPANVSELYERIGDYGQFRKATIR